MFVRHTLRNQLLPSDHFFHAVQILDAAGIWTKAHGVRKQVVAGISISLVTVKLSDSVTREHLREVLGPSILRELEDNATVFLNFVVGAFDENHVFPEDIIMDFLICWSLCTSLWRLLPLRIGPTVASLVAT